MDVPITFPPVSTDDMSDGPLIVEAKVEGYWIQRARLAPTQMELVGFSGEQMIPIGKIELKVCFGEGAQKKRVLGTEKSKVVTREVEEWVKARIVRPVKYPTWISNPVLVKKADGTWRVCIDFKNLNSARLKDYYPLPKIDLKIEAVMGHPFNCFLDAYKVYHQIQMFEEDEDKTAFYTNQGTYCYVKVPFGLKNVRGEWNFLGYMVTSKGIKENPKKTKAIADMKSPKTLKEMQSLSGKLAALNSFLSRWTEEAEHAFQDLKKFILELPTLTTLELKETMFVYLATSHDAVGGILVADRKGKQTPIRYVITDQPIKQILNKPEVSRNLAKYAMELGAHNITYIPRTIVKGQILADFINEIPTGTRHVEACNSVGEEDPKGWTLYTDGASSQKEVGAKYEELLAELRIARKMKVQTLDVQLDLILVACQLNGEFVASNKGMEKYMAKEKEQVALFKKFLIKNIPQNQNQKADVLSKLASVSFNHLTKEILVEVLKSKSMDVQEAGTIVEEEEDNWMTSIIKCLEEGLCLKNKNEAKTLLMKIGQYVVEDEVLFKKSYLSSMLRCVGPLQAKYIIREVHEGACGMHAGARSVVAKIIRQWYYWPTMHGDTKEVVDKCDSCQIHAPVPKLPKTHLTSIMSSWPFYQWGLDILGPLPEGPDKLKFIIVEINYFTKWIEAKPLAKTTGKEIKQMNTTVAHPQDNGLVERANKSLMKGLKARLGRERVGWVDELPNILWAHRTMLKTSIGETPFSLTYGTGTVENQGKLGPNWEGPYRVTEAYDNGSYKLAIMNDQDVPCTWHATDCFFRRDDKKKTMEMLNASGLNPFIWVKIPLQRIQLATSNFAEEKIIARGGFGEVYRGHTEELGSVAVIILNRSTGQGYHEFMMEIELLSTYKQIKEAGKFTEAILKNLEV
nr:reverse transcriptase domain-containing protein [Tanacetum cinerariifolium]